MAAVTIRQKISRNQQSTQTPLPATIVLLHGWGVDCRSWQPLETLLMQFADVWLVDMNYQQQTAESLCEAIVDVLPEQSLLMGWSLGGMLAAYLVAGAFAERKNKTILGLVTLAANSQFVATDDFLQAMKPSVFAGFLTGAKNNLNKQLKRFHLLVAQGDENSQQQFRWLENEMTISNPDKDSLIAGLDLLKTINNTQRLDSIKLPSLFLFGENDKLVPADAVDHCHLDDAPKQCFRLRNKGHCLHYPEGECHQLIQNFLEQLIRDR